MTPLALALAVASYGLPNCPAPEAEMADREVFVLCHSSSRKTPLWVGYELEAARLAPAATRRFHFRADRLLVSPGARNADYEGSGYSRGHMAPARDFAWSEEAARATFVLSNATPQRQSVNAGAWSRIETIVRRIAAQSHRIYVFTGPIFDQAEIETIGPGHVAVPAHFFKVVLALQAGRKAMFAAIVPNTDLAGSPLKQFITTVDEVERRTGLDFFAALEDGEERLLESSRLPQAIH